MTTHDVEANTDIVPRRSGFGDRPSEGDRGQQGSRGRFTEPLDPIGEAMAEAAAHRAAGSWRAPAVVAVASYVAIAVGLVAVGWLLVHTSVGESIRTWDGDLSRNVSAGRSSGWSDYSSVGTSGADTLPVVAGMVGVSAVLVAMRRWRDLLFVPLALALELSVFLTVNHLVGRERPEVSQLGTEPGTASFPSGHVAATLVLWVGIAVLLGVGRWRWPWRILAWAGVAVPVVTVAFSRVYRGMHFTTDVIGGAVLGALALGAAAVATRSSWLASEDARPTAPEVGR